MSSNCAASAAKAAAKRKEEKYIEIACNHHFLPITFETFGPINRSLRTSFLHWAIESLLTLTTSTYERHFPFFNAFPLRSIALMPSVSPIRSAFS